MVKQEIVPRFQMAFLTCILYQLYITLLQIERKHFFIAHTTSRSVEQDNIRTKETPRYEVPVRYRYRPS